MLDPSRFHKGFVDIPSALPLSPSLKYTFEQGGMLVYDVKAQLCKNFDNPSLAYNSNTQTTHFEGPLPCISEGVPEEDAVIYEKIKSMPSCPNFPSSYNLYIPDDNITLTFNSKFESGNLSKAIKLSDYEYSLTIRSDIHSNGNNHWYYFSVFNPRKSPVTFHITNMRKNDILYRSGMKPAIFSQKTREHLGTKWHRDCTSIDYKSNGRNSRYFTLTFTYNFKYEADIVYFAYAIPYTYIRLQNYLKKLAHDHSEIVRVDTLCKSLAGNDCFIVTITENINSYPSHEEESKDLSMTTSGRRINRMRKKKSFGFKRNEHKRKKGVVITARVHSGETVSSFMCQGALDFLVGDTQKARLLRSHFVFKVVPMLNPDGVRYGNYRCSLLGVDLNRRWDMPHKLLHPTIFTAKRLIQSFNEKHKIQLFCDMHGHTKKKNVFMYGCSEYDNDYLTKRKNLCARMIPVMMENNKFFQYSSCHFRIEPSKMSTARIVMYKELDITHSYTMEASFFGPDSSDAFESTGDLHMNETHLGTLGETLCQLVHIFLSESLFYSKIRFASEYLNRRRQGKKIISPTLELEYEGNEPKIKDLSKIYEKSIWDDIEIEEEEEEESEDSGGSESSPEERIITAKEKRSLSTVKSRKPKSKELMKSYERLHKQKTIEGSLITNNSRKIVSPKIFEEKLKRYTGEKSKNAMMPRIDEIKKKKSALFNPSKLSMIFPDKHKAISAINNLDKRSNRFLVSQNRDKSTGRLEKANELPKINDPPKVDLLANDTPFSPQNYNFINYSWVEEYGQSIFNSLSSNPSKLSYQKYL